MDVAYLQGVMRCKGGSHHAEIVVDGQFGRQTRDHLKQFQRFFGKPANGRCDGDDWEFIDMIALHH